MAFRSFKKQISVTTAIAATMVAGYARTAGVYAGSCTQTGSTATYNCNGAASTTGTDTPFILPEPLSGTLPPAGDITVTFAPGFGLNTSSTPGSAAVSITTSGTTSGSITVTDVNASSLTGATDGVHLQKNDGTGGLTLTSDGSVTGTAGNAVAVYGEAGVHKGTGGDKYQNFPATAGLRKTF